MFLKYWLPILLWAMIIFTASSDQHSAEHSSRIIGPLVRWLLPQLPDATVNEIVTAVRKCAHLVEYAVLACLLWRVVRKPVRNDPHPWRWSEAVTVWVCVALVATSDEIHQAFVPTRQASPWDVLIDVSGGVLGLLALWFIRRRRQRGQIKSARDLLGGRS